jgi:hypothetical protein
LGPDGVRVSHLAQLVPSSQLVLPYLSISSPAGVTVFHQFFVTFLIRLLGVTVFDLDAALRLGGV